MSITAASLMVKVGADTSQAEKGLQTFGSRLNSIGQTMGQMGTRLSLGLTAPLAGVAAMALTSAADFEQSMNVLQVATGATETQMASLQKQAMQLGAETSFSAGEAAQAMLELGKAGLSTTEIMGAIPGVLDLAAAGDISLARAAEVAANAVNAFNLPASETSNVANMLAAAANASSVEVGDLASAFAMSSAVFAANQQPMDDMITSLAMLGNAGMKGSDAGTSLKTMLLSLANPTDNARVIFKDLGLQIYDAGGNMRGFSDIVNDLSVATAKMTDEQRNAALAAIFGSDAIRAASILTRDYSSSWDAMSDALDNGSAAADLANARMKGVGGAIEYLRGSVDSFLIGAALPYMNMIGDIIRSGADLLTAFSALPRPVMDMTVAFGALLAATGPVMLAVSGLTAAIGFLLSPIGLVILAVGALAAAWATNFGGIQEITAAALQPVIERFNAVVAAFESGTTSFSAIFGELGAILLGFNTSTYDTADGIREFVTALTGSVSAANTTEAALRLLGDYMQTMMTQLAAGATMLQAFLAPAFARVQEAVSGVGPSLAQLAGPIAGLQEAFVNLWTAVQPILTQLTAAIGTGLAVAADVGLNTLAAVLGNLPALITPSINQITETINLIASTISNVAQLVTAVVNGDWAGAWTAAQNIVTGFFGFFSATLANLQAIAAAVFDVIGEIVVSSLTDMGVNAQAVLTSIQGWWDGVWQGFADAIQPVIDGISALRQGIEDFQGWISGISIPNPFAGWTLPAFGIPQLPAPPGFATGTLSSPSGWALVGEQGPELVRLPGGSRVYNASDTAGMAPNVSVVINANVSQPHDIDLLARRVARAIQQKRG